ncbi:MAG: family NAD(P)-dependent oxidoreductase [Acidimicrobiia bacterium]|nr:family NAD(P)-dependent oxidoreductase [Acidimicrobiia bacterium]
MMRQKTAFVTGASRGIGKAIAISLAKAGYDVALAARTVGKGDPTLDHTVSVHHQDQRPLPGSLEETAELVRGEGREALLLRMDLTDLASVEAAVQSLLDQWGGAQVVINNGRHIGPGIMDTILDTPIDEYAKFLMAHGIAAIRIVQMLLPPILEAGGGTFVTISSGAGYDFYPTGIPGHQGVGLGYRIGKAAGHTLVGSIQAEYGAQGVRAFNINPGYVLTERNALDAGESSGFDPSGAAPPAAIGAAVAWMVTNPEADSMQRSNIDAQTVALEQNLYPDWRAKNPA